MCTTCRCQPAMPTSIRATASHPNLSASHSHARHATKPYRHPHCVRATECGAASGRTCSAGDAGSDHAESVRPRLPLGSASMHFTLCPATCRTRSKACTPAPDETCNSSRHMQIGFPSAGTLTLGTLAWAEHCQCYVSVQPLRLQLARRLHLVATWTCPSCLMHKT